jgi:O-antigen ligase
MEKEAMAFLVPVTTFFLLNSNVTFSGGDYRLMILSFLVAVAVILVFTYIRSFFYSEDFFAHEFLTFDVIHPGYFSFYCGVSVLIIFEILRDRSRKTKLIGYAIVGLILVYMTLLSSRTPLFATICLVMWSVLFSVTTVRKRLIYFTSIAALLLMLTVIVYSSPRLKYRFYEALEKNIKVRIVEWEGSLRIFQHHPILGVGTGASQDYLDDFYKANTVEPEKYIGFNSHNYYLHVLMTYGLLGFVMIAVFWIKIIWTAINSQNSLFIKVLILFLLCSLTELMWARQKGIVFFYLFFSTSLIYVLNKSRALSQ